LEISAITSDTFTVGGYAWATYYPDDKGTSTYVMLAKEGTNT
jgi:hypothetical protein